MTATPRRAVLARYLLAGTILCAPALVAQLAAQGSQNGQGTTTAQPAWDPQQILRAETYVRPPAVIERIIMAPRVDISFTTPSPDRKWFIRTPGHERGDIRRLGQVADGQAPVTKHWDLAQGLGCNLRLGRSFA